MGVEHLTTLMHETEQTATPKIPDLARIRQLGRRRRTTSRLAVAGAVVAVVGLVGGATALVGRSDPHGGVGTATVKPMAPDHKATGLTAYEKRALAALPGSYAVDGTVVVPGTIGPDSGDDPMPRSRLAGPLHSLGFHVYAGGVADRPGLPEFLKAYPPKNSQVVTDQGPVWLGCTRWPDETPLCVPSVLGRDATGTYYYVYGLGKDEFLQPGSEMEVFTDADYTGRVFHGTVIGGFPGTRATRVEVTTVQGDTVEASLDRGQLRQGATLFWAVLPADAAKVVGYDAAGKVVVEHTVRACHSPVDCEVR